MGFIDTHCHLNDDIYNDQLIEVIKQCEAADIEKMIVVGYDMPSSLKAVAIANAYPNIYAAVGFHPSDADKYNDEYEKQLMELVKNPKVIAIGEIGLEYHWDDAPDHELQKEVFRKQLRLAQKLDLPIIIHNREAMEDTYNVLSEFAPIRGIMHCYSGSLEMALRFIKQGLHISFAGPVTFKNAKMPKEVASKIPLERLLVETDCPYLTPHPHRGKLNYPYYVNLVGEEIAFLRGISTENLQKIVKDNVFKLFNI